MAIVLILILKQFFVLDTFIIKHLAENFFIKNQNFIIWKDDQH